MKRNFRDEALFELRFWLQILGDHGRFIYDTLSPGEKTYVKQAENSIEVFDGLLEDLRSNPKLAGTDLKNILNRTVEAGQSLRKLKLSVLKGHLTGDVTTQLPPSFINHMVNELDEALRVFSYLVKGVVPPEVHPLHHDLIWLLDAAGHAGAIHDNLDHVEYDLRKKGKHFMEGWEDFYLKAIELAGYLRANVTHFPALSKFHKDIELEMIIFKMFLRELEEMELNKETLGVFTALMADHMAREECYYLIKLAETTELVMPDCDPGKPRTEG